MMTAEFLKFIEDPKEVAKTYRRFLMSVAEADGSPVEPCVIIATTFTERQANKFASIVHEELKPEWN